MSLSLNLKKQVLNQGFISLIIVAVFVITIVRYSLGRQNLPMVGGRDACQGDSGGPVIRSSISSFSSLLSSVMGRFLEFMLELEAKCSHPMFFNNSSQNWVPFALGSSAISVECSLRSLELLFEKSYIQCSIPVDVPPSL